MIRSGIHNDFMADLILFQFCTDGINLRQRYRRILGTKEAENLASDLARPVNRRRGTTERLWFGDTTTIKAGRGFHFGLTSGQICHMTADTEPHRTKLVAFDEILSLEER